jgi:hypothetical protein
MDQLGFVSGRTGRWGTVVALLWVCIGAQAAEIGPRFLTDPAYLPLKGQLDGMSDFAYGSASWNQTNNVAVQTAACTQNIEELTQEFTYGVTDAIAVRLTEEYQWSAEAATSDSGKHSGEVNDYDARGWTDPSVEAVWRYLDQGTHPLNADLSLTWAPDVFNARYPGTTKLGTEARGGQTASADLEFSRVGELATLAANGGITYAGQKTAVNGDDATLVYSPYAVYFLGVNTQTRFGAGVALNLGLTGYWYNAASVSNDADPDGGFVVQPGNLVVLATALNWQPIPDRLALAFTYGLNITGSASSTFGSEPKNSNANNSQLENVFGVRAVYVLF